MIVVLAACGGAQPPAQEPPGGVEPLGAVSLPELRSCVNGCEQDQIEGKDCPADCHESCLAECDREASERPLQFKKRCREDCDRQLERL